MSAARRPAPALAGLIEQYYGYRLHGYAPGVHRGLPSRHVTFIVGIGSPIDIAAQTDPRQAPGSYRCVLSGLQASPALIAHDGNQEGVGIELTPVGFRTLFARPARELWNTTVEPDDVVSHVGSELWERLQVTPNWADRFAVCDEILTRLLRPDLPEVAPELDHAWDLLVSTGAPPRSATSVGNRMEPPASDAAVHRRIRAPDPSSPREWSGSSGPAACCRRFRRTYRSRRWRPSAASTTRRI